jgi:hypothetical protein
MRSALRLRQSIFSFCRRLASASGSGARGWASGSRPQGNVRLQPLRSRQIEIDFVIAILEEDRLALVATLRNLMRKPPKPQSMQDLPWSEP